MATSTYSQPLVRGKGEVRTATTPAEYVKLRHDGWRDAPPAEAKKSDTPPNK